MKKVLVALVAALCVSTVVGCGSGSTVTTSKSGTTGTTVK